MAVIRNLVVKIGADISSLSKGLKKAQSKITRLSSSLTSIGSSLTMKLTVPLILMAQQALKTSGEFEQSMANAASVSGATGEELEKMTQIARDMGKTTVFSASQAADAMYYMASAGYKVEQMAQAIQPILNLASATQNDLAFTTDTVIATLNQFQLESSDAGRVTNVFASAIGNSQATLDKLGTSMKYVGPVANSLGWSLEEATGALSVLYNAGYDGSMAGTSLRQSLVALMNPTSSAKKIFEELGVSLSLLDPTTNKFADIIDTLKNSGISTAQAMEVFGARAGPGMMALLSQGGSAVSNLTEKITDTNAAAEMAEKQINTMEGSIKLMKSMMEEIALVIGETLIPITRELMDKYIMPLLTKLQALSDVAKTTALKIALIAAAIGPVLLVLGKVVKVIGVVVKIAGLVASPIGLIVVAIVVLLAILYRLFKTNEDFRNKVLNIWDKIKTGIVNAMATIKGWWDKNSQTVLQSVMNVFQGIAQVAKASIEIITGVFKKLLSSMLYLWENNKEFRDAIKGIWTGIKQSITSSISFIIAWWQEYGAKLLASISTIFNTIWDVIVLVLDQVIKSITVFLGYLNPIWESLKSTFMSLWEAFAELWDLLEPLIIALGAVLATLLSVAVGVFNGIIQALGPFILAIIDVFNIVIDVVKAIVALLQGDLDGAFSYIKDAGQGVLSFFSHIWESMQNFAKGFVDGFLGFFSSFGVDFVEVAKNICKSVGDWFANLWEDIEKGASNIWTAITDIFGNIGDWFSGLFKDAYDWGANLIACIVNGINDAVKWIEDSVNSVGQTIKDFLGFSSPTKKGPGSNADSLMPNMMSMFEKGIKTKLPNLENVVGQTATSLSGVNRESSQLAASDNSDLINSVLSAMSVMQNASSNKGHSGEPIELSIDGSIFARLMLPSLTKELRRNGIVLEGV